MPDNRNMILAIVLSMAVFTGWQYFIERPRQAAVMAERRAAEAQMLLQKADEAAKASDIAPTATPGALPAVPTRAEMLSTGPRIKIETTKLSGSLSPNGARLDDLKLNHYRETVDHDSPAIVLLNPKGDRQSYYAEFGWAAGSGTAGLALPGPETVWTAAPGQTLTPKSPVTLTHDAGQGIIFSRTIAVDDDYLFTITDHVRNTGDKPVTLFPYGRIARLGTPKTLDSYVLFEGLLGVLNGELKEIKYTQIVKDHRIEHKSTGGWLGITDKYWLTALMPPQDEAVTAAFNHVKAVDNDLYQTDYLGSAHDIAAGAEIEVTGHLFAGAKEIAVIDRYEADYQVKLFDRAIDWGWYYFLTKPILKGLSLINGYVGNFGVAILILTVIMKALFFPLANRAFESSTKMKKVAPDMKLIQERFKDDRPRAQQEIMELYKREKVNPISGCLPLLLQIPVFFALFKVLSVAIEMRHAPFYGWINDLSAPDPAFIANLFGVLPFMPWSYLQIGVWPILMGLTMFVMQKLQPPAGDPTQQQIILWMPVIFIFTMGQMSSGLAIYYTWNNFLSLLQQALIMRRMGVPIELFSRKPTQTTP